MDSISWCQFIFMQYQYQQFILHESNKPNEIVGSITNLSYNDDVGIKDNKTCSEWYSKLICPYYCQGLCVLKIRIIAKYYWLILQLFDDGMTRLVNLGCWRVVIFVHREKDKLTSVIKAYIYMYIRKYTRKPLVQIMVIVCLASKQYLNQYWYLGTNFSNISIEI